MRSEVLVFSSKFAQNFPSLHAFKKNRGTQNTHIVLLFFAVYGLLNFVEVRINAFIEQVGYDQCSEQWEEDFRE